MVGHLMRYHPATIKLKELVDSGELGRIQYIYSNRLNLGRFRTEENILWSFAPHDISTIIYLLGEVPESVAAHGGSYLSAGIPDVTVTTLDFANGVRSHVFVSWLHPFKEQKLVVVGDRKMAVFDDVRKTDKLTLLPQGVIGQALGIAAFPTPATMAAKSAYDEMRKIITDSLRILLFLGLPITVIFMLLGIPIITILFERGAFTANSTQFASFALIFYAVGLIPLIALEVVNRAFYALSDTLTPVLAGGVQILMMGMLSYVLSQFLFPQWNLLPLGGLALGLSISNLLELLLLLWLLWLLWLL
jgi:hypothetical protein